MTLMEYFKIDGAVITDSNEKHVKSMGLKSLMNCGLAFAGTNLKSALLVTAAAVFVVVVVVLLWVSCEWEEDLCNSRRGIVVAPSGR